MCQYACYPVCKYVCLSKSQLRPSESLPNRRNNNTGSLHVTLFRTTLTNFSDQHVPGSQIKTAGRWRDLQRLRAQSVLRIRSTLFVVPASWLPNVLSLLQQGCQGIGRRDRALLTVREVSFAECFRNFVGIKYVIPVALKEVLVVGVDKLECSGINVYCLFILCCFVLVCVFTMAAFAYTSTK